VNKGEISFTEFEVLRDSKTPLYKFKIVTGSMDPLIPVGSSVFVDTTAAIRPTDIIVFWQENKLVCHILWSKNKIISENGQEILVTRPLYGRRRDLSILSTHVLGKVINYRLPLWRLWLIRWRDFRHLRRP